MIKTFRGKLANGDIQKIRLSTNNGLTGYRITKLEVINSNPAGSGGESVLQVFSEKPTAASGIINFDNPLLLACAFHENNSSQTVYGGTNIIFDNKIINQDIYVTLSTDDDLNYYLELDQVKLSKDEATVATLKDMRGRE